MKLKEYKYRINGMKFNVGVGDIVDNIVHVEVNGTPYNVELDNGIMPKAAAVAAAVKRPAAAPRTDAGEKVIAAPERTSAPGAVKSPLPGTVTSFMVKEGDTVNEGDTVCVLEAMKMENQIHSTASGTVKKLCVAPGSTVLEGTDLLIIE